MTKEQRIVQLTLENQRLRAQFLEYDATIRKLLARLEAQTQAEHT